MPRLLPMSSKKLIEKLKELWFEWPRAGGKHRFMKKWSLRIPIPNPHGNKDVSVWIIEKIISEIGYDKKKRIQEVNN